ncbi:MAG: DUF4129 domain-containing protein [Arenimonas sp.]
MRLDQMTVALRVRSPWQAMDLGLRMVRANASAIWRPYFLFAGSVFILCNLLAYAINQLWLGWFLIWWLKPVFDRIPLHVLSHVTFGNYPTFRDTVRAPLKWRFGLLLSWLTYRRFSFWRCMSMPIDILEGLRSERLSLRRSVLIGAVSSQIIGLSFVSILFEWLLIISAVVLFYMFIPVEYLNNIFENFYTTYFNQEPPVWVDLLFNFLYFLSIVVISPFYVGAGFATYLNRRTQLEAWDIEIAFKRIATRLKQSSAMVLLLVAFFGGGSFSERSYAAEAADNKPQTLQQLFGDDYKTEPKTVSDAVKKTYRNKNLSPKEKYSRWEPIAKAKKPDSKWQLPEIKGLEEVFGAIGGIVGFFAEYGLWLLLAILLSWLIWKSADWMPWVKDRMPAKRELDELHEKEVLNLDTLPGNLSNAVRELWAQQPRAALALLYRGSVEKLADRLGTPFPPGATEAECVRRSRRLSQPESEIIFQKVVRAWQAAAYAHRLPNSHEFETLLSEWSMRWEKSA